MQETVESGISLKIAKAKTRSTISMTLNGTRVPVDQYPRFRASNGIVIKWFDQETREAVQKASWSAKDKLLQVPLLKDWDGNKTAEKDEEVENPEGARRLDNMIVPIRSRFSASDEDVGKITCGHAAVEGIVKAVEELNGRWLVDLHKMPSGGPPGSGLFHSLGEGEQQRMTIKAAEEAALEKIDSEVVRASNEVSSLSQELAGLFRRIEEAKVRHAHLVEIRDRWAEMLKELDVELGEVCGDVPDAFQDILHETFPLPAPPRDFDPKNPTMGGFPYSKGGAAKPDVEEG